jgi:hypothetical protein
MAAVCIACQESEAMELRVHPKMKWEGYSSWPPSWRGAYDRGDIFPAGEEGVLKSVAIRDGDEDADPPGAYNRASG